MLIPNAEMVPTSKVLLTTLAATPGAMTPVGGSIQRLMLSFAPEELKSIYSTMKCTAVLSILTALPRLVAPASVVLLTVPSPKPVKLAVSGT